MSEDFKPGTRALLRLAGLDADRSFSSRDDENLALWRAVVVLLMRLYIDPNPESRRTSGAGDAQVVHALRAALAENFGIEAGTHIAWALIHYGCRQKPTMASLQPWERLMFEWQQRRASAPRVALMLRDGGLPDPLEPRALAAVDSWVTDPPSALGEAPGILQALFGRRLVSFLITENDGEATHVELFGELLASVVPQGLLDAPRVRSVTDAGGTRWIVEYGFRGTAHAFESPADGPTMRLPGVMNAVDGLLAHIGRPERVFQMLPGRVGPSEPCLFVVADGVRFGELVRRLRLPTLRLPREAELPPPMAATPEPRPAAPVAGALSGATSGAVADTQPASLLGAAETAPQMLDTAPMTMDSAPASLLGSTTDGSGHMILDVPLPIDEPEADAQAAGAMLPYEQASGPESEFAPGPGAVPADPAMRGLISSLRRSFGAGRLLQAGRWVRLAHVSPPVKIQTNAADPMRVLYAKQDVLIRKGRIVWGAAVPLDKALQAPGKEDLPGLLVYSQDAWFDARPAELAAVATRLAVLRTAPAATPELRRLGLQVRNDSGRPLDVKLPPELSTHGVVLTSFMGVRSHLPDTVLAADWFPVLVHEASVVPLIVPSMFWSAAMRAAWDARKLAAPAAVGQTA
ncbi:MAG: hypothetical protein ACTHL8_24075 [Burkholderiaceae bacterium]